MNDDNKRAQKSQAVWVSRRDVLSRYRIPVRHLDQATATGIVRTVKFSETQQGARLYRVSDLEAWLTALSQGRKPKQRR